MDIGDGGETSSRTRLPETFCPSGETSSCTWLPGTLDIGDGGHFVARAPRDAPRRACRLRRASDAALAHGARPAATSLASDVAGQGGRICEPVSTALDCGHILTELDGGHVPCAPHCAPAAACAAPRRLRRLGRAGDTADAANSAMPHGASSTASSSTMPHGASSAASRAQASDTTGQEETVTDAVSMAPPRITEEMLSDSS